MKVAVEVALQTFLAFFSILFITRILGRQQVAQLTMHEYINGITFGSIAATLATDINQRTWQHLIGLALFGILTFLMSYISVKSRSASKVIDGEPILVIQDGHILEKNLSRFRYTVDELHHLMRKKDVFDVSKIKYGVLETTGELSIIKVSEEENVKNKDLNLMTKQDDIPTEVVVTGNIIYENLKKRNVTARWLMDQMIMQGIKDIRNVYYATIDQDNTVYVDKIEDHVYPIIDLTEK